MDARPEKIKTETVAVISVCEDAIEINFPEKRDDFREIVKKHGCRWCGVWRRKVTKLDGRVIDIAAEITNKLLVSGFVVRAQDIIINNAVAGKFEPENKRVISKIISGQYAGYFAIQWPYGEDFYNRAKRLTGSRYIRGNGIVVPSEHYAEVDDFAQMHGFRLSDGAKELIAAAAQAKLNAVVVIPAIVKAKDIPEPKSKPHRMEVPDKVEINSNLKDE
ncbi:MAG: hypothetical protein WCI51_02245 [Lentisphaerota bacterium]